MKKITNLAKTIIRKIAGRDRRCSSAGMFNTSSAGAVTSLILVVVVASLFNALGFASFANPTNVFATDSTITLSVNDNMSVDAMPSDSGAFSSSTSTVTVATNHISGYTLTIAASSDSDNGALTSTYGTIPTINATCRNNAASITQVNFSSRSECNDMWGYAPSYYNSTANTAYYPSPTTTGDTLDITSAANDTAKSYTIGIGTKVTTDSIASSYTKTFVVSAVGNLVPYTITYNSGVVSGMPSDVNAATEASTITLSSAEPTADGYNFLGWCTVAPTRTDGADTCTGGTTYSPGDTYSLSSGTALNLYAMWEEDTAETWYFDEWPTYCSYSDEIRIRINFSSNSESFTNLSYSLDNAGAGCSIKYDNTDMTETYLVEGRFGPIPAIRWIDEAYRTITITGGEDFNDPDFRTWLSNNATRL